MTTDAPAIGMILTDNYHRAKRAALAFSAALLVASLSATHRDITIPGVVSLALDPAWLKLLLWATAAYHVWLFRLEYATAMTLNSSFMRDDVARSFDERVQTLDRRAAEALTKLEETATRLANDSGPPAVMVGQPAMGEVEIATREYLQDMGLRIQTKLHIIEEAERAAADKVRLMLDQERDALDRRLASIQQMIDGAIGRHSATWIEFGKQHAQAISFAEKEIRDGRADLASLNKSVTTLSDTIAGQQRMIVRHADRTAVHMLFGFSTVAALAIPLLHSRCATPWSLLCFP